MTTFRIALANLRFPASPEESVALAEDVIARAGVERAGVVCFPECFRWAVRHAAQLVFHPHLHEAEPGGYRPSSFDDPASTFHEKAALCRGAENTCWFATVNYASAGSPTTSAVVRPDGTLLCHQPYGEHGLLVAEVDLAAATGLLAARWKPS